MSQLVQVLKCQICSARVRRQNLTTQAFINRFVSHTLTHFWLEGDE